MIGINAYPHVRPLRGCVNDARAMRALLVDRFGFPDSNVRLLLDADATREGILAEMDALVERAGEDDVVVMFYAGHGSQMTDRENDEPDGMDETIVAFDSGRGEHPNRDITDDEIHAKLVLLGRKTPHVTLIFDSCHSGTIARDAFGDMGRSIPADERPPEELPPSLVDPLLAQGGHRGIGPSGWLPIGPTYLLMAGCRSDQSAYEHTVREGGEEVVHGAFTYFLARELADAHPGKHVPGRLRARGATCHGGQGAPAPPDGGYAQPGAVRGR
ncbi:MAG TPA: caspase family protein [Longimicrobium sp.]|uniref:caspase family protein n=1 Tax=Longimicrobium sp. TaxID=2029185 RepID=UPI002EDB73E6